MRIKRELPQFSYEKALVVVAGSKHAKIYFAHNGEIDLVDSFLVAGLLPKGEESLSMESKKGELYGFQSFYQLGKPIIHERFAKILADKIKWLTWRYKTGVIYLFSPNYIKHEIVKKCPESIRSRMHYVAGGNYTAKHPFKMLEQV